jgi:hypothetical protein
MMEVEKDEEKEIVSLVTKSKVTKALKQMVKEWSTLRVILQTKKVTKNQCCNNLLEYLFSPTSKPLYDKIIDVTKEDRNRLEDDSSKKKEVQRCFSILVTIKGFYVGEVLCDVTITFQQD